MSLLETRGLSAFYGDFQALFGIDVAIEAGETVAIIGANGAGKSTFLKSVVGLIAGAGGEVLFEDRPIAGLPAHEIVVAGISLVPEGRRLFPSLSVEENLRMGAYAGRAGAWSLGRVYKLFPVLAEKRHAPALSLSGGQQQMAAIGRALMSNPRLLLCDELSLGLAPAVIKDIYARLAEVVAEGATLVIVEQDINQALAAADRFYCLQEGRVSLNGAAKGFDRAVITAAYFGV
jgi:branched-chain amino acid transport system ATP-binding protein